MVVLDAIPFHLLLYTFVTHLLLAPKLFPSASFTRFE